MKRIIFYLTVVCFACATLTIPAQAQIDVQNLTPQQQRTFENRLQQLGIKIDYNSLSTDEKERYFQYIRQEEQRRQQAGQGQQRVRLQNVNVNNFS